MDRKSRWTRITRLLSKQADHVADTLIATLGEHKKRVYTLTMDNGNEFAPHERIRQALQADIYFAHPYCAWERGFNENTNGLLRQYFPKGTNFKRLSETKIRQIEKRLNDRPRKRLGFYTPEETFQPGNPG